MSDERKRWSVKVALLLGFIALASAFLAMWLDSLWIRWVESW